MTKHKWKIKEHSLYKMIVWFADGNIRTFYSLDWKNKYSQTRDATLGLRRLTSLAQTYGSRAKTIMLYQKRSNRLVAKFIDGVEVKPVVDSSDV